MRFSSSTFLTPNCFWYSVLYLKITKIHFHEVSPLVHSDLQYTWKLWKRWKLRCKIPEKGECVILKFFPVQIKKKKNKKKKKKKKNSFDFLYGIENQICLISWAINFLNIMLEITLIIFKYFLNFYFLTFFNCLLS